MAQTIGFGSLTTHTFGDPPFTVSATGGASGNPVTFQAIGNCTASGSNGSTITLTGAGSCTVTANQVGSGQYTGAAPVVQWFAILRGAPAVTWPRPANITYGTALSARQLNATSRLPGKLRYAPGAGTLLPAGANQEIDVHFAPADSTNYVPVVATTQITVLQASQHIALMPLPDRTYGDASFVVSVSGNLAGTATRFAARGACRAGGMNGKVISLTGAGSCTVAATQPGSQNYRAATAAAATFRIGKAAPRITWSNPAAILVGTPLGTSQLNARATFEGKVLKGTYVYAPAAGTKLSAGKQTLRVTFTPSDRTDFTTASASISVSVVK